MDACHSASLLSEFRLEHILVFVLVIPSPDLRHHRLYKLGTVSKVLTRWKMYKDNIRPRIPNSSTKSTAVRFTAHFVVEKRKIDSVKQICVSACKDSEVTLEHDEFNTITLVCLFLSIICIFHWEILLRVSGHCRAS